MTTPKNTELPVFEACPECDRAHPDDYDPDVWHGCRYCNDEPLGPPERCNGSSVCVAANHTEGCYGAPSPDAWTPHAMTTPENTEPPVEELIGWEWAEGSPYMRRGWWERTDDGFMTHRGSAATVDDLAGWLDERTGFDVSGPWHHAFKGEDDRTAYWEVECDEIADAAVFAAPTILAALEAAVRAVHEQENTR